MNGNKLPVKFLIDNPLKELSAAKLTHFHMVTILNSEFNKKIDSQVMPLLDASRRETCEQERMHILKCNAAEDFVQFMRKVKEPQNKKHIVEKALSMQDSVMPLIFKRFLTSGQDVFLENAAIILANADMKYVEQAFDIFNYIRNPYARSVICIVFGERKRVDYTSLLLEQYERIKKERPDKDYEQGPLLALYLIHGNKE